MFGLGSDYGLGFSSDIYDYVKIASFPSSHDLSGRGLNEDAV